MSAVSLDDRTARPAPPAPPAPQAHASMHARARLSVRGLELEARPPASRIGPIDLTLEGGALVGLVGASGVGKTSLLRALCGLSTRPVRGTMSLDTASARDAMLTLGTRTAARTLARWRGRDLAWISAHGAASLDPRRSIGAQASEMLRWFDLPTPSEPAAHGERASSWTALGLDATAILAARPDELSIGQGHRAALALALLPSPGILLVDEPAGALDETSAALVWDRLHAEAHERGRIVVVVDHELDRALTRCDRALVLARDDASGSVRLALDMDTSALRDALAKGHTPQALATLVRRPAAPPRPAPRPTPSPDLPRLELRAVVPPHPTPAMRERPIDLALRCGEIHALLGPSGIGKTSLLHVVVGLLPAERGDVFDDGAPRPAHVHGLQVVNAPALAALRRVTQLVWQDSARALDPRHDLTTALRAPARHAGRSAPDDASIERALGEVGLAPQLRHRTLDTLSGGERQRVAILRALLANPEVLVLDEPTAHLDAPRIRWLVERLIAARDAGGAILLATHDRRFASELGAIVLELGAPHVVRGEAGPSRTSSP